MKNINLIFKGLGYNDINQAYVCIYDLDNNIISKSRTYNARLKVFLKCNCFYKIKAISNDKIINKIFYINDCDDYIFTFNDSVVNNNTITFRLTDKNYDNLLIWEGNLILWQK